MALLSDDILGAFPSWAKAHPRFAALNLDNIVVVTLPQTVLVEMMANGGVRLGNLTLDVSRKSGFYPDIFMGYAKTLEQLAKQGVVEPNSRLFSRNRGLSLLVRKYNPLAAHDLSDVVRLRLRIGLPDSGEARAKCRAAAQHLLGKAAADALFETEVTTFPGRLGIMHRDLPEMLARGYADVALTWHHLVSYWVRIFPEIFEAVQVPGGEAFFAEIAFGRVSHPLRSRAMNAFGEFFFERARNTYPKYDFARMSETEFGRTIRLL